MPLRFPGMDPWLENPVNWPGVHATLIATIRELLVPQLRPRYFADIERRVYVLGDDDPGRKLIIPDVIALVDRAAGRGARSASATTPATAVLPMVGELPVRESRVVIRATDGREVVTVLEVLSPTNKVAGSRGREEYLTKRRELLESPVHFVEVDLLRAGERFPSAAPLPPGQYYAHVSRAPARPQGAVWAWTLREPAPRLPVPLSRRDEAVLDLGRAIQLTYERGGYDAILDYDRPPDPPLAAKDASWAAKHRGTRRRRRTR